MKELITKNRIEEAFDVLTLCAKDNNELNDQVILLSTRYKSLRRKEGLGIISANEVDTAYVQIIQATLDLLKVLERNLGSSESKKAFISYSHSDIVIAMALKDQLVHRGISVTIDSGSMLAGENIENFIQNAVFNTDVTISIVSKKSLLSAWVAEETTNTFNFEKLSKKKKFIACFIDDDFFRSNFTDEVSDIVDKELAKVSRLKMKRVIKGRNTRDLDNYYTRLKNLSNNIDEIVRRLRESLCIDLRGKKLEESCSEILRAITL